MQSKQFIWILIILLFLWLIYSYSSDNQGLMNMREMFSEFNEPGTDGGALDIYYPSYTKMPSLKHPNAPRNPEGEQTFIYYPTSNLLKNPLPEFKVPALRWDNMKPYLTNMEGTTKPSFNLFDFITNNVYTDSVQPKTPIPLIASNEEGILKQSNPEKKDSYLSLGFYADPQSNYSDVFLYDASKPGERRHENLRVETIFHINAPGKYFYRFMSIPKTYPQTLQKGTIPSYYLELTPNGTLRWALHRNDLGQLWTLQRTLKSVSYTVRFTGRGSDDIYFVNNVEEGSRFLQFLNDRNFNVNMKVGNTLYTINNNLNAFDQIYQKISVSKASDNSNATMRSLFGSIGEQTRTITCYYKETNDTTPFEGMIYNQNYGKKVYLCTENLPGVQKKVVARSFEQYQDTIPSYVNRMWFWNVNRPVEYFVNMDKNVFQEQSENGWREFYADMLNGSYFIPSINISNVNKGKGILKIDFTNTTKNILSIGNRNFGRGIFTVPMSLLEPKNKNPIQPHAYYSIRCLSRDLFIGYRILSFDTSNTDVNRLPITLDMQDSIFIQWTNPPPTTNLRTNVDVPKIKVIRGHNNMIQSLTSPDPTYFNYMAVKITQQIKESLGIQFTEFFENKPSLSTDAILNLTNLQAGGNTVAQENLNVKKPSINIKGRVFYTTDIWYAISQDQTKILYNRDQNANGDWLTLPNGTKKDDGRTMKIWCLLRDRLSPNRWYAVGQDYKVYERADIYKNTWRKLPDTGDVTYISQLDDGSFLGIGTNKKIYSCPNFVTGRWTKVDVENKDHLKYASVDQIPNTNHYLLIGNDDRALYMKKDALTKPSTSLKQNRKIQSVTMPDDKTLFAIAYSGGIGNRDKPNVLLKTTLSDLDPKQEIKWSVVKNMASDLSHMLLSESFTS
jgi:hypothetical protein